jgi:hypothetical protein
MEPPIADALARPDIGRSVGLLRSRHRRQILLELSAGRTCSETDVTMRSDGPDVPSDLKQTHLPMLEAEGIIEWDRETGEISKGPNFEEIEPLLRLMREHADDLPPDWP